MVRTPPPQKKINNNHKFFKFRWKKAFAPPPPPHPRKKKKNTCYRLRRPVNLLRLSENSIRDREVGNYLFLTHARIQRGIGGPDPPPRKITSYIGFYRNKDLYPPNPPPPPPKKKKIIKSCTPPPPPPPINVSTLLNRKKYNIVAKKTTINTLIRVFFCYLSLDAPGPCFYLRGEGGGGGVL